jgi:tyrosyl-tRNA synthetase
MKNKLLTEGMKTMGTNAYDVLRERGFIEQCTHEDELRELLEKEKITFYIGYDPTADSLTAGHFLTLMALAHLQKAGHRPITLMGTGTGMVGDPSERSEMRKVMTKNEVDHNIACFKRQFSRFINYGNGEAIIEDNNWLLELNYISFIREYGVHFSVNRMLSAESYKARLESGLTFFEFNYQLMQAYDFLHLYRKHNCRLQLGGNDQWSNIIAGSELIRKVERGETYGLTFTLLTTGDGKKMGKSMGGAVWLDAEKTSPYEFYQYWRNTDDAVVIRNLKLLTFLSMDEIHAMEAWEGAQLNKAKEILAYEVTKTVHGQDAAEKAKEAANALFAGGGDMDSVPVTEIPAAELGEGMHITALLLQCGLIPSGSEGRRLIAQGGIKVNGKKIGSHDEIIQSDDFSCGYAMVQKGKKVFHRVKLT